MPASLQLCDFGLAAHCPEDGASGTVPCSKVTNWLWLAPEIQQQLVAIAARRSPERYTQGANIPQGVLEGLLTQLQDGVWDEFEEVRISGAADIFSLGAEMAWAIISNDIGQGLSADQLMLRINEIRHAAWRREYSPPELPTVEQVEAGFSAVSQEAVLGFLDIVGQCVQEQVFRRPSGFELLQRLDELVVLETRAAAGGGAVGGAPFAAVGAEAGMGGGGFGAMVDAPVGFGVPAVPAAAAAAAGGGWGSGALAVAAGGGGGGTWSAAATVGGGNDGGGWVAAAPSSPPPAWGVPPTGAGVAADPTTYSSAQSPTAFGAYDQQQMGQHSSSSWVGTSAPLAQAAAPAAGGFVGAGSGFAGGSSHTAAGGGGGAWVGGFGAPRMESYASGDEGVGLGALMGGAAPYLFSGELSQDGQGVAVPPIAAGGGGSFSTWVPGTHEAAERAVAYTDANGSSGQLLGYSQPSTAAPFGFGAGPSSSLPSPSVGVHAAPPAFGGYDHGQCSSSSGYNLYTAQPSPQQQQQQQHWQHAPSYSQPLEQANSSFQKMSLSQQPNCAVPASPLNCGSSNFSGASYDPGNLSNSTSGVSNYSNYNDPVAAAGPSQPITQMMQAPLTAMATGSVYTVESGCRGNCTDGAAVACDGGGGGWCGGDRSPSGPVPAAGGGGGGGRGFGGFPGAQMPSQQYNYTHGQHWQPSHQQQYGNGIQQQQPQQQHLNWTQHQQQQPGTGGQQQQQQYGGVGWM